MIDHTKYLFKGKGINYFDTPNQTRQRVQRYTLDTSGNIKLLESLAPEGNASMQILRYIQENKARNKGKNR